jgi:excisionase family DNA binding protein
LLRTPFYAGSETSQCKAGASRSCPAALPKFLTIGAAAKVIGIPYFKLQRAVRAGLIPSYRLLNNRRLLKLSEVLAAIDSTREVGE